MEQRPAVERMQLGQSSPAGFDNSAISRTLQQKAHAPQAFPGIASMYSQHQIDSVPRSFFSSRRKRKKNEFGSRPSLQLPVPIYNGPELSATDEEERWAEFFADAPDLGRRPIKRYKIISYRHLGTGADLAMQTAAVLPTAGSPGNRRFYGGEPRRSNNPAWAPGLVSTVDARAAVAFSSASVMRRAISPLAPGSSTQAEDAAGMTNQDREGIS